MRWTFVSRNIFVDSSAFASLVIDTETHFRDATTIANVIAQNRQLMVTTNFIVAETHALVLSRVGRRVALQSLEFMEQSAAILERVSEEDELNARAILEKHDDKTYSYTDAT